MTAPRITCPYCETLVKTRAARGGDGSVRLIVRHLSWLGTGRLCVGSYEEISASDHRLQTTTTAAPDA